MRLEKATWHNMGPHSDWSLDLTALPPETKLVALVGTNGRGKSFSLESAVAGACYRTMPTQGTLARRAMAVDSWLESTLVHDGRRYTIKHLVNGGTGKGETVVVDADTGEPAYKGGTGFKLFDGWAARHLPDPDVLFASIFAAQQSEGFVKMTSGERIGIVLRVLGVAKYERMAAVFRKNRETAVEKAEVLGRRVADIRGGAEPLAHCEAKLEAAIGAVVELRGFAAEADQALAAGRETEAQARVVTAQREAGAEKFRSLQQQLDQAQQKRDLEAEKLKNNRAVLADRAAIEAAVARTEALRGGELGALDAAVVTAKAEADTVMAPWADVNARLTAEQERLHRAETRLKDAGAVQEAKSALPSLRDALAEAEGEVTRRQAKLDEVLALQMAGVEDRLKSALKSSDAIWETYDENTSTEASYLADMARLIREEDSTSETLTKSAPAQQKEARERLAVAKHQQAEAQAQLTKAERLADRGAEVDAAGVDQREADAELQRLRKGLTQARLDHQTKGQVHAEAVAKAQAARAELEKLAPLVARAAPLAKAETRITEIEPLLASLEAEVSQIERSIAELPPLPVVPVFLDVGGLERKASDAQAAVLEGEKGITRAEQAAARAREVETLTSELEAERVKLLAETEHWARLALDFGRDGIQSALVDSAGPELTELINDLLRTCHGPRFTVSVETQRVSADGKKTIEECNIRVIDTIAGTDKEVREHSGGERVILGEAISLALTMLACRRAGWVRPTLIRDESAAALDPGNARAWVAMMRRAVELTGADRLLFVSHSPEVVEMADAQIEVGAPQAGAEARAA